MLLYHRNATFICLVYTVFMQKNHYLCIILYNKLDKYAILNTLIISSCWI